VDQNNRVQRPHALFCGRLTWWSFILWLRNIKNPANRRIWQRPSGTRSNTPAEL